MMRNYPFNENGMFLPNKTKKTIFQMSAEKYAEMKFSVIPISADKIPMIEFADRHFFTLDVIKFWDKHRYANIAIRCTNIFVFDIDINDKINGFQSAGPLINSEWWPQTLSQTTGSGGRQYIFKKPKGEILQQIISFLPGVDIKWHPNNYFLVPPSVTNKGVYRWDNQNEIADCPPELLALLKERQNSFERDIDFKTNIRNYQIEIGGDEEVTGKKSTTLLFEMIVNGFGDQGGRNDALVRFVASLLAQGVDADIVQRLAEITNENTNQPIDEREFTRTLKSVLKMDRRN